jgi:aspartyl-tRNA(Asn)/glutamyl-tRNA(Gln) amidotransferase subunit A
MTETIADASRALREGAMTSVELTARCIARADELDGSLGAYLHRTDEAALEAAASADASLAAGNDLGPLHGIPLCVKDIFATADAPTTAQSLVLDPAWGRRADAAAVARLRAAGAVLTGKTTTMEFAIGLPDPDKPFPVPRNPWSPDRWAGGSSSGTAIAIATGMALGGPGTDTGGSIRIPSAYCGTTGLKPTHGRVSAEGCYPLAPTLDHVGPMARTALDCALLLDVLAGFDPDDAFSVDVPTDSWASAAAAPIEGMRIGVDRTHHVDAPGADPATATLLDDALTELERAGASVREISLPRYDETASSGAASMFAEAYAHHRAMVESRWDDYGRATRQVMALGKMLSAATYIQAQRVRRAARRDLREAFADVDAVVCLTAGTGAPSLEGFDFLSLLPLPVFAGYWNATGLPAMSVPMGFDRDGLPLGLQIAGRAWDEATVLRVGHTYQQRTDWHRRRPGERG